MASRGIHSQAADRDYQKNKNAFSQVKSYQSLECDNSSRTNSDEWVKEWLKLMSAQHTEVNSRGGLWDGGIVKYSINSSVKQKLRDLIYEAVQEFNDKVENVHFVHSYNINLSVLEHEVEFIQDDTGAPRSPVGCQRNGKQQIKLCLCWPRSTTQIKRGNVMHEMMHTIGFYHEHCRCDRNQHITIKSKYDGDHNYDIKETAVIFPEQKYDFDSIMHYGSKGMTVNDKRNKGKIGQRKTFSDGDVYAINKLYKLEARKLLIPWIRMYYGALRGEGFLGNAIIRTLYTGCALTFVAMFGFTIYFQDLQSFGEFGNALKIGYSLSGFAAIILFVSSLTTIFLGFFNVNIFRNKSYTPKPLKSLLKFGALESYKTIISWVILCGYIISGLFYFMGGCTICFAWNSTADTIGFSNTASSSVGGLFFAEHLFVGLHAIIAGLDFWNVNTQSLKPILNVKLFRVIVYNISFFLLAIIAFFAYAVLSCTNLKTMDNVGAALNATFYFFVMFPLCIHIVFHLYVHFVGGRDNCDFGAIENVSGDIKAWIVVLFVGSFVFCVAMILIGYFVFTANWSDIFANSDFGAPYFVGIGLFVFLCGIAIAFDMGLDQFVPLKYGQTDIKPSQIILTGNDVLRNHA